MSISGDIFFYALLVCRRPPTHKKKNLDSNAIDTLIFEKQDLENQKLPRTNVEKWFF